MLAVSKVPSPYAALSPESIERTATAASAVSSTATDAIARFSSASRSTEGSAAGSTDASWLDGADAEGVTDDADDTAPASACARSLRYTVPVAVPPATTAAASAVQKYARRRQARARW
ncbi:hypothetical protein SY2F82_49630 [Streptomyces sp. Y2F8-2]|nr:hypothetical protein SY2F82_49630 [Streptomyces sp. Y2F8-2]